MYMYVFSHRLETFARSVFDIKRHSEWKDIHITDLKSIINLPNSRYLKFASKSQVNDLYSNLVTKCMITIHESMAFCQNILILKLIRSMYDLSKVKYFLTNWLWYRLASCSLYLILKFMTWFYFRIRRPKILNVRMPRRRKEKVKVMRSWKFLLICSVAPG